MARSWCVVVVFVMVACGHYTPSPPESSGGSAHLRRVATGSGDMKPNSTPPASDAVTADRRREIGNGHGDQRHDIRTIDGRVIGITHDGAKLLIGIGLAKDVDANLINGQWVGAFTADGKVIEGSDFKVKEVEGHLVRADIVASQVPSEHVRLFPPRYVR